MNTYEQRQEARRERYLERAQKASEEANRRGKAAFDRLPPMGQPILVGHHSEKRHRRALEKSDNDMRKAAEASDTAAHYRSKADGVGRGGISSDDPEALDKLRDELAKKETLQTYMRNANKAVRAAWKKGVRHDGPAEDIALLRGALLKATGKEHNESHARALLTPDFANRMGFADYQLTNNSGNIRRIKGRIADLEKRAEAEPADDITGDGWRIAENVEENRLQIFFDAIPSPEIRGKLKSSGFRWSRYNGCWQRQLSNAARYWAQDAVKPA